MASKKDYFGLERLVSLILAIIPPTAWILGILTRFNERKYIAAIIRIPLGLVAWILDLYFMLTDEHIARILDC